MNKNKIITYTDNRIGSGNYCECGREYTHDEWDNLRYSKKRCLHIDYDES